MKNRRWLWIIVAFVVLLAGLIGFRWWNRDIVTVKVATSARVSIEEIVSASGTVNAPEYDL